MTNTLDTIRRYLSAGNDVIVASSIPTVDSHLSKRSLVHLQKRVDWCTSTTYCADGSHCIGGGLCKKDFNWYWIVAVVVFLFILTIFTCIRRRRTAAAMSAQPVVETIAVVPQNQYSAYPPPQNYAPPAGDPNMAYQTPAAYVPPTGSPAPLGYAAPGTYAPPTGSPYPEKPYDAPPPAAYSPYPPAGGPAYSAPYSPAPYSAAAATPATAYSAPYTPPGAGQPQLVGNAAPAPYPVPQGEASSYAPPK
ncbi:hypothetical protein K457DRAFT_138477 [Linnemannia elongata AG-77]|uniref:Uncharacterized protein n=1 Tax=Linnemannia elongata AG-77 TaxID=1314771 RepID=A0A197JU38_9FUNG|nr:hypothetical protein K457DRAFT_138477 [Linnemannia elongata AG-77]